MENIETKSEDMIVTETGAVVPKSDIEEGHIRVYLTEKFNRVAHTLIQEDGSLPVVDVKSPGFDFVDILGVTKMSRTFPYAGEFEERTVKEGLDRWYDIWFDKSYPVEEAIKSLAGTEVADIAECRPKIARLFEEDARPLLMPYPSQASATTSSDEDVFNDPMFKDQWHYYNDGSRTGSVSGCDINVVPVWQSVTTGDPSVIVSVVDQGVDYSHEDLAANMWHNPQRPQNPYGYNFVKSTYVINPDEHGTHVAGTIAAVNNNGIGVSGVAGGNAAAGLPGVKIMSCQIFDGDDDGNAAAAIKWGADHGAVISQNSWGYTDLTYIPASDREAIDYFNTYAGLDASGNQTGPMAGGIVIFSAGNEDHDFGYPAEYEGALAVSALGADYLRAYYSNYGDWIDVAAPGGDAKKGFNILSTIPGNQYGYMQGTSMACPHISGVAALIVSKFGGPGFTRDMLWNRLVNTTNDVTYKKYNRSTYVGGLVDALAATATFGTIAPDPVTEFSAEPLTSNFVQLTVKVPADEDDGAAFGVTVYYDTTPITSTVGTPSKSFRFGGAAVGENFTTTLSGLGFDTKYYLRCVAYDLSGNHSELSDEVTVVTSKNQSPVITYPSELTFELRAHETKYLPFSYTDPDGHNMAVKLSSHTTADSLVVMGANKAQIVLKGSRGKPGTYTSTVTVTDEYDGSSQFSYTLTVYANHAPVVKNAIPDQLFTSIGTPADLNFSDYISDEDGETLKVDVQDSGLGIVHASVMNGHLYITPLKLGSDSIKLTATDSFGESVTTEFRVAVRSGDDPLSIYPNPVKTKLYISTGKEESDTKIILSGQTGRVFINETVKASAFNPAVIDMTPYAPGVYLVTVEFEGKTYTKNIVKI